MNPVRDDFAPQINNAVTSSPQPTQPIPQQIPPINTQLIPVKNQAPKQQVPTIANAEQSPELEASTPITGKSRIESAWGSNPEDMGVNSLGSTEYRNFQTRIYWWSER